MSVSKYRTLKRFTRVGDVVQVKTSGNLYDVVAVDKTPGRITYEVTSFYDVALVNGFSAYELDVIAKRDADELREERAAAQAVDAVEYVAQLSQRRRTPSGVPSDEQRSAAIAAELAQLDSEREFGELTTDEYDAESARVAALLPSMFDDSERSLQLFEQREQRAADERAADERLLSAELIHALSTHPLTHGLKVREIANLAQHVAATLLTSDDITIDVARRETSAR